MTKSKKIATRILSLVMAVSLSAGLFIRQTPQSTSATTTNNSNISKIDAEIYNDLSSLFDTKEVSKLPETVSDDQDISVIVEMSTKNTVDTYTQSGTNERIADYLDKGEADNIIAAADRERTSLIRMLDASGVKYVMGETYNNVLSGFEITVKASDFYKVESLLSGRKATAIVGDVYEAMETEPVFNYPEIDEDTGIFKNTMEMELNGSKVDGSGVVVAVLDTGLDYTHSAFAPERFTSSNLILTEDNLKGKIGNLSAAQTTKNLKAADVYMNKKIPYAYDYADKDTDVLPINSSHGTHVAGIIAGKDDVIEGVAPNAQLAIMKVFSDETDGAKTSWLIAALDDCIKLGVDVINMSLGSSCGFTRQEDKSNVEEIYNRVYDAGISLIAAASNDYNATMGSKKNGNNGLTTNPDSGTVGSPSTYPAALSVASVDGVKTSYLKYGNEIMYFTEASTSDASKKKDFVTEILKTVDKDSYTFDYVYIPGVGKASDYPGDVSGKIVLVERGDITFEQKVQVASDKGAAGIIVFNNVSGNISMSIGDDLGIAVCSLARDEGRKLAAAGSGKIEVSKSNKAGPFMSDFSSWGPTSDLKIKPEITAHGGEIKSAVPGLDKEGNSAYEKLSGTSMAAPNQAGATALIRQYVKYSGNFGTYDKNGELNDKNVTKIVNQLMMSTADILYNKNGLAYAVRKQGAGLMSLSKTEKTPAYILTFEKDVLDAGIDGKTATELKNLAMDKTKLELGDDKERTGVYKMTFAINNFSGGAVSYDVGSIALTEGINNEYTSHGDATVTMNGYALNGGVRVNKVSNGSQSGNKITVNAGSIAVVTVTLALSDSDIAYLEQTYKGTQKVFEYGMYVEGFITLTSSDKTNGVDINVPFLTFYGDWTEAPIFDEEYYDTNKDELNLGINDEDKLMEDAYATRVTGGLYSDYIATMGTYYFKQSSSATKIPASKEHIALSNQIAKDNKSNWSISSIRSISAGLLRNAKRIKITATEDVTGRVVYMKEIVNQYKSHSSGSTIYGSSFDLEDENGVAFNALDYNLKNNTKYNFRVEAFIDFGADEDQHNARKLFEFPVYVDFEAPVVTKVNFRSEYNKDTKKNRLYADISVYDNHYTMGIQVGEVVDAEPESGYSFSMKSFGNYVTPVYSSFNSTNIVTVELTDYIDEIKQAKGFTLPNGDIGTTKQATNAFIATCYDYAMNSASYEIRIPDDVIALYYNEDEIKGEDLYLSPNETKSLTDLIKVYPYTAWGEVLNYDVKYFAYNETKDNDGKVIGGEWQESDASDYLRIVNGKVVALKSTGTSDNAEYRPYVLITPKGVTGHSVAFPSLKVYVYSEGESGYKRISANAVAKFTLTGYTTEYAFYTLDSDDRNIGFTGSTSEIEKDKSGAEEAIKMYPYEKIKLNVVAEIYFTDLAKVVYTSSNEKIVKVNDDGLITALAKGKAIVSAKIMTRKTTDDAWKNSGQSRSVTIEVKDPAKLQAIYLMSYKGAGGVVDGEFNYVVEIPGNKGITTIYDYAFSGYRYVDKDLDNGDVVNDEDPYYIKQQFIGNNFIKKVIIPEGVTTINKYAFAYLTALEEVVFPSTLTKIGVGAFQGCNNLQKITFSGENNLQFINKDAFKMVAVERGSTVRYFFDEDEEEYVDLGESKLHSIDLSGAVAIGNYAFQNASLTSAKLPETCQSIGIGSFMGCKYLGMLGFGSDEMKIGSNAFKGCERLSILELNTKVVSANICEGMTNLTDVTLGSNVQVINQNAFAGCVNLKSIKVAPDNTVYKSDNDGKFLYTGSDDERELVFVAPGATFSGNTLTLSDAYKTISTGALSAVSGTGKITKVMANGVNSIGDYAFYGSSVESLTTDALTEIGDYAFYGSALKTLPALADGATIGAYAFSDSNLKVVETDKNGLTVGDYAFANCDNLTTVKLGNNVTLGAYAFGSDLFPAYENYMHGTQEEFYRNYLFARVYSIVATIGSREYDYEFNYSIASSSKLTSVTLGENAKIGDYAFSGNVRLTGVTLGENTEIGSHSFYNNPALATINLANATKIGDYAFSGDRLNVYRVIQYSNGLSVEQLVEKKTVNGKEVIVGYGYTSLASAIASADLSGVTMLGKGAFADCTELNAVTLSTELTSVNDYTFMNTGVSPELSAMTEIGSYAFYNTNVAKVDLSAANSVGSYAFAFAPVTEVTFKDGVEIGDYAFAYCANLEKANLIAAKTIGKRAFTNTALKTADLANAVKIGEYAFGESALESVTLGATLEKLGDNPFYGCNIASYGTIETNEFGVEETVYDYKISEKVFVENGVIYQITEGHYIAEEEKKKLQAEWEENGGIGERPKDIEYELISAPQNVEENFTVKEGTFRIGGRAFQGVGVVGVILPYELKSIGDKAFYDCAELTTVVFNSLAAPSLEEEYDEYYYLDGVNSPFVSSTGGLHIVDYFMWNATSRLNNLYYGANFVDYVGKVTAKLAMICPANGTNYDEFIFGKYFGVIVRGGYAATEQTKKVIALIDKLPDSVTLEDEARVVEAREAYDGLGITSQQSLVTNYGKLTKAESLIKYYKMQNDSSSADDSSSSSSQNAVPTAVWIVVPCVLILCAAVVVYFAVFRKKKGATETAPETSGDLTDDSASDMTDDSADDINE